MFLMRWQSAGGKNVGELKTAGGGPSKSLHGATKSPLPCGSGKVPTGHCESFHSSDMECFSTYVVFLVVLVMP